VTLHVNMARLEHELKNGLVPAADISNLLAIVRKTVKKTDMSIFEKANPSRQGCLVPQSELVTLALKPYQLASVSWMSDIEERSGRGQTAGSVAGAGGGEWLCSHVMKCQTFQSPLLFDVYNNRVLCEPVSPDSRLANFSLRVKGGILADEMGIGKTVTLIGLFVHNSPSHIPRIPSRQAVLGRLTAGVQS